MQLTQKDTALLKDLTDQEKLCIDKYTRHAQAAADPQLKNLFSQLAAGEQKHLQALNTLSTGTVPAPEAGGGALPTFTAFHQGDTPEKQNDCYLCTDALSGEKHVSALYDTCVFEFTTEDSRNLLNSIQKQEQAHGEMIYDYMKANQMYA